MSRHSPIPTADGSVCGEDNEPWPCRVHRSGEPQPSDGPDYHAEHAFWAAHRELTLREFLDRYWDLDTPPSDWQAEMIGKVLEGQRLISLASRQVGRTVVSRAIARMFNDL